MLISKSISRFILGTRLDATSYKDACDRIQAWIGENNYGYIVPANVHVVMTGHWRRRYQKIINQAALVTPDGMPLVLGMRLLGVKRQQRVYGPDLMLAWCKRAAKLGIPIYLYGGTPSMLSKLQSNLEQRFPGLIIAGTHSPPFRPLTLAEERADVDRIHASGAKVVFVGLGCPKQEAWMARQQGKLQAVSIGVGAAFSYFSGEVSQAPRLVMKLGLEWLYRLTKEPRRLWRRYLVNNPAFLCFFGIQLLQQRVFSAFSNQLSFRVRYNQPQGNTESSSWR